MAPNIPYKVCPSCAQPAFQPMSICQRCRLHYSGPAASLACRKPTLPSELEFIITCLTIMILFLVGIDAIVVFSHSGKEIVRRRINLVETRACIWQFIEVMYNQKRLHSGSGYLPPVEFEQTLKRKASLPYSGNVCPAGK